MLGDGAQHKRQGAARLDTTLRAFFCALLLTLLFYTPSERPALGTDDKPGMGAPPPPLLESSSLLRQWGGLERRVLGAPLGSYGDPRAARAWRSYVLPAVFSVFPAPPSLALLGQWRLEGG